MTIFSSQGTIRGQCFDVCMIINVYSATGPRRCNASQSRHDIVTCHPETDPSISSEVCYSPVDVQSGTRQSLGPFILPPLNLSTRSWLIIHPWQNSEMLEIEGIAEEMPFDTDGVYT